MSESLAIYVPSTNVDPERGQPRLLAVYILFIDKRTLRAFDSRNFRQEIKALEDSEIDFRNKTKFQTKMGGGVLDPLLDLPVRLL